MSEVSWTLSDGYLASEYVGDSLSEELRGLEDVAIYDFDRIVRNIASDAILNSIDCLAVDDG